MAGQGIRNTLIVNHPDQANGLRLTHGRLLVESGAETDRTTLRQNLVSCVMIEQILRDIAAGNQTRFVVTRLFDSTSRLVSWFIKIPLGHKQLDDFLKEALTVVVDSIDIPRTAVA